MKLSCVAFILTMGRSQIVPFARVRSEDHLIRQEREGQLVLVQDGALPLSAESTRSRRLAFKCARQRGKKHGNVRLRRGRHVLGKAGHVGLASNPVRLLARPRFSVRLRGDVS